MPSNKREGSENSRESDSENPKMNAYIPKAGAKKKAASKVENEATNVANSEFTAKVEENLRSMQVSMKKQQEDSMTAIKGLTEKTGDSHTRVMEAIHTQQANAAEEMMQMKKLLWRRMAVILAIIVVVLLLGNFGFSFAASSMNKVENDTPVCTTQAQSSSMAASVDASSGEAVTTTTTTTTTVVQNRKKDYLCGTIKKSTTLSKTHDYIIQCPVMVASGVVLTIERGTTICAVTEFNSTDTPQLIISVGAKLISDGTKDEPITFTSCMDIETLKTAKKWGLWGGLLILGKAPVTNSKDGSAGALWNHHTQKYVDHPYGGNDPDDNSGIIKYVRIWYGGGEEINALTLAGVGRGTILHHVETIYSGDDGFELQGGTVNGKELASYYAYDDAFDFDNGYQGDLQFIFAMVADVGDSAMEVKSRSDDGEKTYNAQPRTHPRIRSATILGNYPYNNKPLMIFKEGAAGSFDNLVMWRVPTALKHIKCADVAINQHSLPPVPFDYPNYLYWSSNNIVQLANATSKMIDADDSCAGKIDETKFDNIDPLLESVPERLEPLPDHSLNLQPQYGSPAVKGSNFEAWEDTFYRVKYRGAFSAKDPMWILDWSWLDRNNKLVAHSKEGEEYLCGSLDHDKTLWANVTYYLACQYFVHPPAVLTIMPGTTFLALEDQSGKAPVVVIEQGAKIMADGTADQPITMTTVITDEERLEKGLWGGLIVCGKAPISAKGGTSNVEGLENVLYGGDDPEDNSGIIRYIRAWYGGSVIGIREINGMTFAAVGTGTIIEHIEVAHSKDDGIVFSGGTAQAKWLSVVYPGDDGIDTDEGFQGKLQFVFVLMNYKVGENGMEMDSMQGDDRDVQPRSHPQIRSATIIGTNTTPQGFHLREGTGGSFKNVIISGTAAAVKQTLCGTEQRTQTKPSAQYPDFLYFDSRSTFVPHKDLSSSQTFDLDGSCVGLSTIADAYKKKAAGAADADSDEKAKQVELFLGLPDFTGHPLKEFSFNPTLTGEAYTMMEEADKDCTLSCDGDVVDDAFFKEVKYQGAFSTDDKGMWLRKWSWLHEHEKLVPPNSSIHASPCSVVLSFALFVVGLLTW